MYYGKIRHLTDDLQAQCRIIKEQFRCHKFGFEDMVNFMTCELNNVRISHKMRHITNLSIFNIMPMKKFFCIFGGLLLATGLEAQTLGGWPNWTKYIENTAVFEENQEEGHAFYVPENNMSLNGKWNFLYLDVPTKVPANFYAEDFDDSGWNSIPVPSNWEMQGFGDALFRNVHAPFKANPPYVPDEYNPTGVYRQTFNIPDNWKGQQVFLRMEKTASASFVYLNGNYIGYNEGAQEPAEYNLTPYIKLGKENTLAICVLKYSDGYYLEGQDYWRLAGIFDDIWLYATPETRLFDWFVRTDLDETYTDADLYVDVDIKNYGKVPEGLFHINATLLDENKKKVTDFASEPFEIKANDKTHVKMLCRVNAPKKWTSETPNLYTLEMELIGTDGSLQDAVSQRIGFKETEIRGETFLLNGVPLKINAQNSHMQHPEMGHAMTEDVIRKDFEILKQFNFNAVRTSHYPPVHEYLELADEYGLFIIDEAGVEAHATEFVSQREDFTEMYRERVRQMVLRDRNHPCILFWSAGKESGEGFNIAEVIKEGRKYDDTRYWMYGGNAFSHPAEEIIGPRYPTPIELELQVGICSDSNDIRPSFMDEYLSVAGNGGGGLDDYWRVIYAHPRTMGGAIWDFVSPGLKETIRRIEDNSPFHTPAHLMGNARLVAHGHGKALDLNGHDQWVEIYRQDNVEINTSALTLTCEIFPRELVSSCGSFLTKGNYQFGLQQYGKDSLDFYLYTNERHRLRVPLPSDWEGKWHQLSGVYDGKNMTVYLDGKIIGSQPASGTIRNFPFPVNVGRNAEMHGQETDVYICDALLDNVGIFTKALTPEKSNYKPDEAVLWLDFEKETDEGTFYSYGIGARTYGSIWPDRKVQPEMWQMKKTVQPLAFSWLDAETGWVEVWNRNHFLNASHYQTRWFLEADGKILEEGELNCQAAPLSRTKIRIPFHKPKEIQPGVEYRLTLSSSLRKAERWAPAGFEIAWEQLELPWYCPPEVLPKPSYPKVELSGKNGKWFVSGTNFKYIFDQGKLVSLQHAGKEMLREPLKLNVWRAPLANEQDQWCSFNARSRNWKEGFGQQIATEYYSTGIDNLTSYPISVQADTVMDKVILRVREICCTKSNDLEKKDLYIFGRQSNGFENLFTYTIDGDGSMTIQHTVLPQGNMPLWLPRIGLCMTLDASLNQVEWYGRGPQENYPDRKTGYKVGIYQSTVDDMYEPYLIPQDYGLRTDNRWLRMTDTYGKGLLFKMNQWFNFNAYPYSTDNLTKAMYTYQLERQNGITLNIDYATTGVGCTARSVFNAYRVYPQGYHRIITICPIGK